MKAEAGRLEVPWREGTATRSARREDLVRILSPLQRLPDLEVLGAALEMERPGGGAEKIEVWRVALKVFVTPRDNNQIVIPFHRCEGELTFPNQNFTHTFSKIQLKPSSRNTAPSRASEAAVISVADAFILNAELAIPQRGGSPGGDAHIKFKIYPAGMDQPAVIDMTIPINMTRSHP